MRILVLCTGNRCRSQMAHGIIKHLHPEYEVCSAGVRPASEVHPLAKRMKDGAAGFVLVASLMSFIIGMIMVLRHIL